MKKNYMGQLVGLGWFIVISFLIFCFGGLWLDQYFDSSPLFVLAGSFLALVSVFWQLFKIVNQQNKKPETFRR